MASVTPMAPARSESSSRKRPLSEDDEARRAAVERQYVLTRPRLTPVHVTPTVDNKPRSSSHKHPLSKDDEARRAAVERQYWPTRPRTTPSLGVQRQELLRNSGISLPVTKLGLSSKEVKAAGTGVATGGNEHVQHIGEVDLPEHHPSHGAVDEQLETPVMTSVLIVNYADAAVQTEFQGALQLPTHNKELNRYQSKPKKQAKQLRDIYQIPEDLSDDEPAFDEPATSSFRFPTDEPEISSFQCPIDESATSSFRFPIDEPEICSFTYSPEQLDSASTDSAEEMLVEDDECSNGEESTSVRRSEATSKSLSAIEMENYQDVENMDESKAGREAHLRDSPGEQLNDEERMLLGEYSGNDEPLPTIAPSSRTSSRQIYENLSQASHFNYQIDDGEELNDGLNGREIDEVGNYEELNPNPSKLRRSGRQRSQNVACDALKTLVNRRSQKSKSRASRGTNFPSTNPNSESVKRPRRLPVNELITVSERVDESDLGGSDSEIGTPGYHATKHRLDGKRHKGIGPIDITQFRLPDVSSSGSIPPTYQCPSYRDGFEGIEAKPTGWTMPVKCPSYKRATPQRVVVNIGKLTLVREKPSSQAAASRNRKKKKKPRPNAESHACPQQSIEQENDLQLPEQFELHSAVGEGAERREPQEQQHDQTSLAQDIALGNDASHKPKPRSNKTELPEHDMVDVQAEAGGLENGPLVETIDNGLNPPGSFLPPTWVGPLTPQIVTGEQEESGQDASTTPPFPGTLQNKSDRRAESNEPDKLAQFLPKTAAVRQIAENGLRPHSQRRMTRSDSSRTPKQIKAHMEAMLELSMVTVKCRLPEDDEDDSQQGSDEDQNYEESSNSGQSSEDEEEGETSSNVENEEDSDREDAGILTDTQQSAHSDDDIKNEHRTESAERCDLQESTLNGHPATSLYGLAKKALEIEDVLREVREALDDDTTTPLQDESPGLARNHNETQDSSWRPRVPSFSGLVIEVDEDIEDSPTLARTRSQIRSQGLVSRRRSRVSSQSLDLVHSRPVKPHSRETTETQHDTQESMILGETQNFVLPEKEIPETQYTEDTRFQVIDKPSYFSQASQALNDSHRLQYTRTKSSPGHFHLGINQDSMDLMSATAMFRATRSPSKSSRLQTLMQDSSTAGKSLESLTRRASQEMGTLPARFRSRTTSLSFQPPFKNTSQGSGRSGA